MMKLSLLAAIVVSLVIAPQDPAAKKSDDPLKGVKCCMMSKNDVKKDQSVAYHDGQVYFCCAKCKASFEKDPAKFAVKANQQLVQTKQYVQKHCPMTGEAVDEKQMVKIGDTEVHFCCGDCVKAVNEAKDDDAKAKLIFSNDAFNKAFVKADAEQGKDDKEPKKDAPAKDKKSGL